MNCGQLRNVSKLWKHVIDVVFKLKKEENWCLPTVPLPERASVDAIYGSTHERTRSCGARKSSMQLLLRGAVRPVAGENRRRPMNASPGGTPSGQAHALF